SGAGRGGGGRRGLRAAVEPERAAPAPPAEVGKGGCPRRGQHAEGDREIVVWPLLADAGGGEIDGDASLRVLESGVAQGRADAVGGLAHRAVRQPDGGGVR